MPKTRPCPILGFRNQSPLYRIPVHVPQLLLCLLRIVHVEVVVAPLPELPLPRLLQQSRSSLLQHLYCRCERAYVRFAHEKMNVLRHQHIPSHNEFIVRPCLFELLLEYRISPPPREKWEAMETAERDEVKTTGLLNPNETFWHGRISLVPEQKSCYPTLAPQGWGTRQLIPTNRLRGG